VAHDLPGGPGPLRQHRAWLEDVIDAAAMAGAGPSTASCWRPAVLDAISLALIGSPWPVVMAVICVVAWRSAGPRVAIFTAAALAYIALLGYWEIAMETVALVGAAVVLCVASASRWASGSASPARLQLRRAGARPDADAAGLRLPDPDHRLLRHRQPARHPGHDHLRHAAGDPPDGAWHARGAREHQGGGHGLRRVELAIAARRGDCRWRCHRS
jgi:hypothetical protein